MSRKAQQEVSAVAIISLSRALHFFQGLAVSKEVGVTIRTKRGARNGTPQIQLTQADGLDNIAAKAQEKLLPGVSRLSTSIRPWWWQGQGAKSGSLQAELRRRQKSPFDTERGTPSISQHKVKERKACKVVGLESLRIRKKNNRREVKQTEAWSRLGTRSLAGEGAPSRLRVSVRETHGNSSTKEAIGF